MNSIYFNDLTKNIKSKMHPSAKKDFKSIILATKRRSGVSLVDQLKVGLKVGLPKISQIQDNPKQSKFQNYFEKKSSSPMWLQQATRLRYFFRRA